LKQDYDEATKQKNIIEDNNRKDDNERKQKNLVWVPKYFSSENGDWVIKKEALQEIL
jgi:hypothetical protein